MLVLFTLRLIVNCLCSVTLKPKLEDLTKNILNLNINKDIQSSNTIILEDTRGIETVSIYISIYVYILHY